MSTPYELEKNPVLKVRLVALVPRWSVVPVIRRQTNGEHIFLVARYAKMIVEKLQLQIDLAAVLAYALEHDDDEAIHGDLPSSSYLREHKTRNVDAPQDVMAVVTFADQLEAYCYVLEEIRLGNTYIAQLLPFVRNRMLLAAQNVPKADRFIAEMFEDD